MKVVSASSLVNHLDPTSHPKYLLPLVHLPYAITASICSYSVYVIQRTGSQLNTQLPYSILHADVTLCPLSNPLPRLLEAAKFPFPSLDVPTVNPIPALEVEGAVPISLPSQVPISSNPKPASIKPFQAFQAFQAASSNSLLKSIVTACIPAIKPLRLLIPFHPQPHNPAFSSNNYISRSPLPPRHHFPPLCNSPAITFGIPDVLSRAINAFATSPDSNS